MYACDDSVELSELDRSKMMNIPFSLEEAIDIARALKTIREFEHGSGEIRIPLVNGLFDKVHIAIVHYRTKKKQAK